MIWWTLALFFVSFLVTALLAPKPDIENARPDSLDSIDFPRATEDAPIPLVLGKVRFQAPNTIWYGDFSVTAITERIRVSAFKKVTLTVGYNYFLGLDLALAMGPGIQMHEIMIDDTSVWTGSTSTTVPTTGTISAASLFGGYKAGGGFSGGFTFYPGSFSQGVDPYVESEVGAGNVPAYRGLSHIVLNHASIGESATLRKIAFVLSNYSNAIGAPNSGMIGEDMNPMEAIYQVMTDPWRGLGVASSLIDLTSFQDAATTLYNEGNGCSVIVTSAQTGKNIIAEILRQIDAIMFQDPDTGRFVIKLIRFDYDLDDLPTYDEDDVVMIRNFTKTSWEDVIAQVKVSFPSRTKESSIVAVAQDMATAGMIGRLKTSTLSFPFVFDPDLANRIAARELATSSVPLFRATVEMNRNGYKLRPGDVFKLDWPEYGLAQAVFRVQKHDLGALLDNKIVIECLQDSFAQSNVVISTPATSAWVAPTTQPVPITVYDLIEAPRFIGLKLANVVADGTATVIPVAQKPTAVSTGFDMVVGAASGTLDFRDPEAVAYPSTGILQAAYAATAGFTGADATGFVIENAIGAFEVATSGDLASGDGGLLWVNGEWMSYSGVMGTAPTITLTGIRRGLFGTQPLDHALATRVWHVNADHFGTGALSADLAELGTAYFKLLDRVGGVVFDAPTATQHSKAMADLADRPARPRNLKIDGVRSLSIDIMDVANHTVTWSPSNRNATSVTYEQDAAQTPDQTETYDVTTYVNGSLRAELSATGVTSPWTLPTSTTAFSASTAELRVKSRRTTGDLKSSAYYAWIPFSLNQIYTPPVDAYLSSVKLLIGAEGTDGSTTIIDESPSARTLTVSGAASIKTAGALVQTSSLAVNYAGESSGYVQAAASADFNFGTGDFTIEGYAQSIVNDGTWYHSVLGNFSGGDANSWSIFLRNSPSNLLQFSVNGATTLAGTTDLNNTKFHFAVSRNGGTARLFVNGVMEDKSTSYAAVNVGGAGALRIGGNQAGVNDMWRGLLDEIRVTKGVGRYNSDATFVPQPRYSRV